MLEYSEHNLCISPYLYSLKHNMNNKRSILKSYDILLNDKYNVVLNQKTIERVKNFFQ